MKQAATGWKIELRFWVILWRSAHFSRCNL